LASYEGQEGLYMIPNEKYDKIKLIHDASCLAWFIEKHALAQARGKNNESYAQLLAQFKKDIEGYITAIEDEL